MEDRNLLILWILTNAVTWGAFAVILAACYSCSTTDNLTKPDAHLSVTSPLDAQHTAFLVNDGLSRCMSQKIEIQQIGDARWTVSVPAQGAIYGGDLYTVAIDGHNVKIAAFANTHGLRRNVGMIASWISDGAAIRCRAIDDDMKWWTQ